MTAPSISGARNAAVAFVLVTVALDVIAMGLVIPVLPKLVENLSVGDTAHAARIFGVCAAMLQGGLIKPIIGRIGERAAPISGLMFGVAGFFIYGLAPNGWMIFVAIPVATLWGLASSSLQSMMSRLVDPSAQGQLQGASSRMMGIGNLIAPGLFTQVFAWSIAGVPACVARVPGTPFLVGAAVLGIAAVIDDCGVRHDRAALSCAPWMRKDTRTIAWLV